MKTYLFNIEGEWHGFERIKSLEEAVKLMMHWLYIEDTEENRKYIESCLIATL